MVYLPSDGEWELLRVIWELQPVSVRNIHDRITRQKPVGYTTVLKQIQRMHENKGVLQRDIRDGVHLYSCPLSEETLKQQMVEKMIQVVFRGSADELRAYIGADASPAPMPTPATDPLSVLPDTIPVEMVRAWMQEKTGV
jgi:BlaI family transcriptional regulator, penicillinase repressor